MTTPERQLEEQFIEKLRSLKYEYRPDIRDRAALEKNFREKFESLNRVQLTEGCKKRSFLCCIRVEVRTVARPRAGVPALVLRFDGTIKTTLVADAPSWGSCSDGPLGPNSDRLEATPIA